MQLEKKIFDYFTTHNITILNKDAFKKKKLADPLSLVEIRNELETHFIRQAKATESVWQTSTYDLQDAIEKLTDRVLKERMKRAGPASLFNDALKKHAATNSLAIYEIEEGGSFLKTQLDTEAEALEMMTHYLFCVDPSKPAYVIKSDGNGNFIKAKNKAYLKAYEMRLGSVFEEVDGKKVTLYEIWKKEKLLLGTENYRPNFPLLFKDSISKQCLINLWEPPSWLAREEELKQKKTTMETVHPYLRCFLTHLLPDETQRDWVLNWIRCSKDVKLTTFLTLIGPAGTGKGSLYSLCEHFHGPSNSHQGSGKSVIKKFNSIAREKTLMLLDEAKLSTSEDYFEMKRFANNTVATEGKFKDEVSSELFVNFVWTANDLNSMRALDSDDRRFSIPDISTESLAPPGGPADEGLIVQDPLNPSQSVMFNPTIIKWFVTDKGIAEDFVSLLLNIEPDYNLANKPLVKTANSQAIRLESRPDSILEFLNIIGTVDMSVPKGYDDFLGYDDIDVLESGVYAYRVKADAIRRVITDLRKIFRGVNSKFILKELQKLRGSYHTEAADARNGFVVYVKDAKKEALYRSEGSVFIQTTSSEAVKYLDNVTEVKASPKKTEAELLRERLFKEEDDEEES